MLWVSMGLRLLGRPEKKYKIKGDRGEPAKNPPMLKLVFSLEIRNFNSISGEKLTLISYGWVLL